MRPQFTPGNNIALKVPAHEYSKTVHFYESILGFARRPLAAGAEYASVAFAYGDKNLWIDCVEGMSQAEVWLELQAPDVERAQQYLADNGCYICNEIERLPNDFDGFWVSSPCNIIHLVTGVESPGETAG
ncbi:MAG: hypothetical protein KJO24_03565 [Gammaproteobacteria bacterium]|nr:hypothetical protein [Gammaproteobacteria bacterium]